MSASAYSELSSGAPSLLPSVSSLIVGFGLGLLSPKMAEEMQELRDLIAQLRSENEQLKSANPAGPSNLTNSGPPVTQATERLVFVPREKKCPIFRGGIGISINEWVEEATACMRARHLSSTDKAYFLFDHLEGEAREEIRYRSREEREDPDKIFKILQELYGCPQSYVALQEAFFSRKQQEGESLLEFSIALMTLMDKVKRCAPEGIINADVLLRDQFVEYVGEGALRRALKQFIRNKPTATLIEVRKEAIRWEQEGSVEPPRPRSFSLPSVERPFGLAGTSCAMTGNTHSTQAPKSELAELKEMLRQQQLQIEQLTRSVASMQDPPRRNRFSRDGPLICMRCQQPGHYARDCDGERVATSSQIGPRNAARPLDRRPSQPIQPSGN